MPLHASDTGTPVILLALANDREAYLGELPAESEAIKKGLENAVDQGLCKLDIIYQATIGRILDAFAKYNGQVAIFHFAGHANSYSLLLETADGKHAQTHLEGLTSLLQKQAQLGLKLVFLNGCASGNQALALLDAGVPAVIGTSQSINDSAALQISSRFYQTLGRGLSIVQSWQQATDEILIQHGNSTRDLLFEGQDEEATDTQGAAPWRMHHREGAGAVLNWNLPQATQQPLFGLPAIPDHYQLPNEPYRFLQRYTRNDCRIFFGRSAYVRNLYYRIQDERSNPIILLYGQSGVGKSSLLESGLFPRLENNYRVAYYRRQAGQALADLLKQALHSPAPSDEASLHTPDTEKAAQHEQILSSLEDLIKEAPPELGLELRMAKEKLSGLTSQREAASPKTQELSPLISQWKRQEEQTTYPLILLIDQVEEAFTKPLKGQSGKEEMEAFAEELGRLFGAGQPRPKGKIILTFRKEYLPEVEEQLKNQLLPFQSIYLDRLNNQEIEEIILGLSGASYKHKYNLSVEKNLPSTIIEFLRSSDKQTAIAPVLQIILTKLWEETEQEKHQGRHFSLLLFEQLRNKGLFLQDFLGQQFSLLAQTFPKEVQGGLALEVLYQHTTSWNTANSCSEQRLIHKYGTGNRALWKEMTHLSLLVATKSDETTLTHDTLAPVVRKMHQDSELPGQRASRILHYRYQHQDDSPLTKQELDWVLAGKSYMGKWTEFDETLVRRSQEKERKAKRVRMAVSAALLLLSGIGLALFVVNTQQQVELSKREKALDSTSQVLADSITILDQKRMENLILGDTIQQKNLALIDGEKALETSQSIAALRKRIADAAFFAANSLKSADPNEQRRLAQLALRTMPSSLRAQEAWLKAQEEAISYQTLLATPKSINAIAIQGNMIATAGKDGHITILKDKQPYWTIDNESSQFSHTLPVRAVAIDADAQLLASASDDNNIRIWDLEEKRFQAQTQLNGVSSLFFSSEGDLVAEVNGSATQSFSIEQEQLIASNCLDCAPSPLETPKDWILQEDTLVYRNTTAYILRGETNDPIVRSQLLMDKVIGFSQLGQILEWDLSEKMPNWEKVDNASNIVMVGSKLWQQDNYGNLRVEGNELPPLESEVEPQILHTNHDQSHLLVVSPADDYNTFTHQLLLFNSDGDMVWPPEGKEPSGFTAPITDAAWNSRSHQLAVGFGSQVQLWDTQQHGPVDTIAFSTDIEVVRQVGNDWFIATLDGNGYWWKGSRLNASFPAWQKDEEVSSIAVYGSYLALGGTAGVTLWKAGRRSPIKTLRMAISKPKGIAFVGQNHLLVWKGTRLQLWAITESIPVFDWKLHYSIKSATLQGKNLIILTKTGAIHRIRVAT